MSKKVVVGIDIPGKQIPNFTHSKSFFSYSAVQNLQLKIF